MRGQDLRSETRHSAKDDREIMEVQQCQSSIDGAGADSRHKVDRRYYPDESMLLQVCLYLYSVIIERPILMICSGERCIPCNCGVVHGVV